MSENTDFFSAFGVNPNDVDENPFSIPKNKYNVVLSDAGVKEFNSIPYFVIEWSVADGAHKGKTASDMHRMIPWTSADRDDWEAMNARALSGFKKALLDLGIPANALSQFNPNTHGPKLVGIKGTATMGPQKNKPEYNSISNFTRKTASAEVAQPSAASSETPAVQENISGLLEGWNLTGKKFPLS
jgi:hypothetical protein